jgi:serine/threonine-protein kinase
VKVLDFGIAKLVEEAEPTAPTSRPLTRIGTIMGTPNYMSPEQAVGQPCDARADIYALGVVFFEMLTGACLYEGDPIVVLAAHVTTPPPPLPPDVLAALGPHGEEVFARLLAKSPDDRYQSAGDLAAALEELGEHVSPLPPTSLRSSRSLVDAVERQAFVTGHTRTAGAAVTAATQLAAPSDAAAVVPDVRSKRMILGAALAVALAGILVLLVFALRGPAIEPTVDVASSSSAAPSATPHTDELPPVVASAEAPPVSSTKSDGKTSKTSKGAATGGHKKGPGGLYIPPPNKWFK